jgi:hypothetical protein
MSIKIPLIYLNYVLIIYQSKSEKRYLKKLLHFELIILEIPILNLLSQLKFERRNIRQIQKIKYQKKIFFHIIMR